MRAKQKFKLSATIIGICFLLHGIPVFVAESSEMIESDLKTNEMKIVEIEEQNRSLSLNFMFQCPLIHEIYE